MSFFQTLLSQNNYFSIIVNLKKSISQNNACNLMTFSEYIILYVYIIKIEAYSIIFIISYIKIV